MLNVLPVKVKPVHAKFAAVVVEAAAAEEKTAGGIIIPDTAKEKPMKGKIIAVSEQDEKGNKPVVKVGDHVKIKGIVKGKFLGSISMDNCQFDLSPQ